MNLNYIYFIIYWINFQLYTLKNKDYLLAAMIPQRTLNHPLNLFIPQRFFTVEKGSLAY